MMKLAATHAKRLSAMHARFEILAAISRRFTKHPGVFGHGGELYHPHETLNAGYTSGGLRRFVMSYNNFLLWMAKIEVKEVVQADALTITHKDLQAMPAYQLCLNKEQQGVKFEVAAAVRVKKLPTAWRVCTLELNSDILDSSKKVTIMSVAAANAPKTEATEAKWKEAIADLVAIMVVRAMLLANRPTSTVPDRAADAPLPKDVSGQPGRTAGCGMAGPSLEVANGAACRRPAGPGGPVCAPPPPGDLAQLGS